MFGSRPFLDCSTVRDVNGTVHNVRAVLLLIGSLKQTAVIHVVLLGIDILTNIRRKCTLKSTKEISPFTFDPTRKGTHISQFCSLSTSE